MSSTTDSQIVIWLLGALLAVTLFLAGYIIRMWQHTQNILEKRLVSIETQAVEHGKALVAIMVKLTGQIPEDLTPHSDVHNRRKR